MLETFQLKLRGEGVTLGELLQQHGLFNHVTADHSFKDEKLFYRFVQDEQSDLLNPTPIPSKPGSVEKPVELSSQLVERMVALLQEHWLEPSGEATSSEPSACPFEAQKQLFLYCDPSLSSVAVPLFEGLRIFPLENDSGSSVAAFSSILASIQASSSWALYVSLTEQLMGVDPEVLTGDPSRQLAFWINLYNCLFFHSIVAFGWPTTRRTRTTIFCGTSYQVGAHRFTLDEIEHGILRQNAQLPGVFRRPFSSSDPRRTLVVTTRDPRIHFALHLFCESSPDLPRLTVENCEIQLQAATQRYLLRFLSIDLSRKQVSLPRVFRWYASDFGDNWLSLLFRTLCHGTGDRDSAVAQPHAVPGPLLNALRLKLLAISQPAAFGDSVPSLLSQQYAQEAAAIKSPAFGAWLRRASAEVQQAAKGDAGSPAPASRSEQPPHLVPGLEKIHAALLRTTEAYAFLPGVKITYVPYNWDLRGFVYSG